jgi:hypothetical protein
MPGETGLTILEFTSEYIIMTKNFWNNWDFKALLTLAIIIGGFIYGYGNLNAKVEGNKETGQRERELLLEKISNIDKSLKELKDDFRDLKRALNKK